MSHEMICPFCQTELEQGIELWRGGHIWGCPKCKKNAEGMFWRALGLLQKHLKNIAETSKEDYYGGVSINYAKMVTDIQEHAEKALKTLNEGVKNV